VGGGGPGGAPAPGWVMDLVPAELGWSWGFAVVLAIVLWQCGRFAANRNRRARVRLAAYRLAVVGSVLMVLRLLSSGLVMVGYGVLIPLSAAVS
jgi:eukaryotic-like serine/threonine-protein kinase